MSIELVSQGLPNLAPVTPAPTGSNAPAQPGGFEQLLEQVDGILKQADQLAAGYAQGKVGLTDAVLASEKADTTFSMVMAMRNRALSAYQEIMNLQV